MVRTDSIWELKQTEVMPNVLTLEKGLDCGVKIGVIMTQKN